MPGDRRSGALGNRLLGRLSMRSKLIVSIGVLVGLSVLVGGLGVNGLATMGNQNAALYSDGMLPFGQLANLHNAELKVRMELFAYATAVSGKQPDQALIA